MVAVAFRDWLWAEERQSVDPYTLQSFERIFDDELDRLIQRCQDNPALQRTLQSMRDCPVRTAKGCTRWTDYALGALIRHCGNTVHLDDAFAYVMFRLLSRVGRRGQPRPCLFDMDPNREYDLAIGNPLLARFRTFLINDVRSIAGKIRRFMLRPNREPTVPINRDARMATRKAVFVLKRFPQPIPIRSGWNCKTTLFPCYSDVVHPTCRSWIYFTQSSMAWRPGNHARGSAIPFQIAAGRSSTIRCWLIPDPLEIATWKTYS